MFFEAVATDSLPDMTSSNCWCQAVSSASLKFAFGWPVRVELLRKPQIALALVSELNSLAGTLVRLGMSPPSLSRICCAAGLTMYLAYSTAALVFLAHLV